MRGSILSGFHWRAKAKSSSFACEVCERTQSNPYRSTLKVRFGPRFSVFCKLSARWSGLEIGTFAGSGFFSPKLSVGSFN